MTKTLMMALVTAVVLAAVPAVVPVMAQDNLPNRPGAAGTGIDSGTRSPADPRQKALPEIERQRTNDLQRGVPPMTTDPRLGPPSASDSGGPGRLPGGSRGLGPANR
jgi:hypothetical protein